ncbi:Rrf2 family transcriptional regulator [bacterium]|nr:Rrf2 family transcriptional regulator [bacterium]
MISQTGQYALRALSFLGAQDNGRYHLVQEMGRELDIPAQYLSKILHNLVRVGLLESQRGRMGGFRLKLRPEQVTLFDILDALEDLGRFEHCILGTAPCNNRSRCPMDGMWCEVRERYISFLKSTTVAQLARKTV